MKIETKEIEINGNKIILKNIPVEDAYKFIEFRIKTCNETYYMARYPEEINKNENSSIKMIDSSINSVDEFLIGAYIEDKLIGQVSVHRLGEHIKFRHKAGLGISILKEYWGVGLGTKLMEHAISIAKTTEIEQINLGVFSTNTPALNLYKKLGFKEWGYEKNSFKLKDGRYFDEIQMVLYLK